METLYQAGKRAILHLISKYLELLEVSDGLSQVTADLFEDPDWRVFLCCGVGIPAADVPGGPDEAFREYAARAAIPHDLEAAVSGPLYSEMRNHAKALADRAAAVSHGFTTITPSVMQREPELLPVFLHAAGTFSKAVLARSVGQVSDVKISAPAAGRLAAFFQPLLDPSSTPERLVGRLGSTIEGQVRDLLGRYLLESLVQAALERRNVPYQREEDYVSLAGVVYDHRADFVIPDARSPKLFIEVRKSSARHASLYAKDKMFSAINWKGKHPDLIGILVADGEWTRQSLVALAKVFDYVLPVSKAEELASIADDYIKGDSARLIRLIHFRIEDRLATSKPSHSD